MTEARPRCHGARPEPAPRRNEKGDGLCHHLVEISKSTARPPSLLCPPLRGRMVQRTWRKPGPWADPRILAVPKKTAAGEGGAQRRWRRRDKLCQLAGRVGVLWGPAPVRERGGGGPAGAEGDVARRRIHNRGISQHGREQSTRPGHAEACGVSAQTPALLTVFLQPERLRRVSSPLADRRPWTSPRSRGGAGSDLDRRARLSNFIKIFTLHRYSEKSL